MSPRAAPVRNPPSWLTSIRRARLGRPAATGEDVMISSRGAVGDAGVPVGLASADDRPGDVLAVAIRASRPDRPSPCHAAD